MGGLKTNRVLFLGNSITFHGPSAAVDWSGNWGMAASAADKDYVHLLVRSLSEMTGSTPEVLIENIADFERQYDVYDVGDKLRRHLEFKADLVIVAIGENVPALASEDAQTTFKNRFVKLLTALKRSSRPAIVVRSCFGSDETKDRIMKEACAEVGGIFVDIGPLSKNELNYARSERTFTHAGVAAHPGDRGMKAIAEAILYAIGSQRPAFN